jgi:hypothetical protein
MRTATFLLVLSLASLGACSDRTPEADRSAQDPAAVGSGRDEHGCITSAGYRWCEAENKCVRPWELLDEVGSENSPEAFDAYCNNETN